MSCVIYMFIETFSQNFEIFELNEQDAGFFANYAGSHLFKKALCGELRRIITNYAANCGKFIKIMRQFAATFKE